MSKKGFRRIRRIVNAAELARRIGISDRYARYILAGKVKSPRRRQQVRDALTREVGSIINGQ